MEHLSVDNLIPIMPETVREEYMLAGDASIFGFSPLVKHWLQTSQDPRVEKWRNDLREYTRRAYREAMRRQKKMNEAAPEFYEGTGKRPIRTKAVIDPVLMAFNRKCFKDPGAILDTQRKEPKLFIP